MKKKKSELYRNEIKSYIVRAGMTMSEVVDYLADEYGWSSSVPNLSGKLKRGSLRYGEAVELADALGYPNPRSYKKYGKQRGWMRGNKTVETGTSPLDGFRELTEEECNQMELPF